MSDQDLTDTEVLAMAQVWQETAVDAHKKKNDEYEEFKARLKAPRNAMLGGLAVGMVGTAIHFQPIAGLGFLVFAGALAWRFLVKKIHEPYYGEEDAIFNGPTWPLVNYDGGSKLASFPTARGEFVVAKQFIVIRLENNPVKLMCSFERFLIEVRERGMLTTFVTMTDLDDTTSRFSFTLPNVSAREIRAVISRRVAEG